MSLRGHSYEDAGARIRTALVVLIAGVLLLLAGLGMALLRGPASTGPRIVRHDTAEPAPADEALATRTGVVLMAAGGVLVAALLGACYALFRVTRRLAAPEQRKPLRPTAAENVWKMHKLADEPPGERDGE
jgi:hypothetical protein